MDEKYVKAVRGMSIKLSREEMFFLGFCVISANALFPVVAGSLRSMSWAVALLSAFKVSAIVWFALWIGLRFARFHVEAKRSDAGLADTVLTSLCVLVSSSPIGGASWIILSAFALYIIMRYRKDDLLRRASWVFLAITFPMFWGRRIFTLFSDYILALDASLVSVITQTERVGNIVAMPGGEGTLLIGAACSSMANVSLAVLCWTCFSQYFNVRWSAWNILWCTLSVTAVISVNIARIALIGFFPEHYDFLHSGGGVEVFSWFSALLCAAISYVGVKHATFRSN